MELHVHKWCEGDENPIEDLDVQEFDVQMPLDDSDEGYLQFRIPISDDQWFEVRVYLKDLSANALLSTF